MTPIKRAARAILSGEFEYLPCPDGNPDCSGGISCPKNAEDAVRAVLASIREPSEAIMKPDSLFSHFYHDADGMEDNAYFEPEEAKRCWKAMIDAMLEEG